MSALNLVMISDISDTCMLYLVNRHRGLSTYKWTNTLQPLLSKLVQWLFGVRQWSHFAYRTLSICDEKDSLSLSRIWETSSKLVGHIWRLVHFEVIPKQEIWGSCISIFKENGFVKFRMCRLLKAEHWLRVLHSLYSNPSILHTTV